MPGPVESTGWSIEGPSTWAPKSHRVGAHVEGLDERTELKGSKLTAHADRTAVLYGQYMLKVPEAGDSDKAQTSLSPEPIAPSWQLSQSLNLMPSA